MLDPIKEAQWEELKKGCRLLGVPMPPEIHIGIELFNRDNKKIYEDMQRGNSWTRNFYNYAFSAMAEAPGGGVNTFGAGYMSGKRTTATLDYSNVCCSHKSATLPGSYFNCQGAASSHGIMVGTSDTAFDKDQHTMQALISHGVASGNLQYGSMAPQICSYAGTTWTTTLRRMFENLSGASITVKETGLYGYMGIVSTAAVFYYMLERNVLDSTIAVADGESLKITYTFAMDFSAID
jgi:hypothetical protein